MEPSSISSPCSPVLTGSGVTLASPSGLTCAGSTGDLVSESDLTSVSTNVSTVSLFGEQIVSLEIDGTKRLCLAQISHTLLKNFSYNEIHNRRVALGITCIQCTPVQLEVLRRSGAMPISSRRCGMITFREAERLCKSFLCESYPPPVPENFQFHVFHSCSWGCSGTFHPNRYNSSRAKCIRCDSCGVFFSPNKFIFHSHREVSSKYNPPDAANFNSWRRHIFLSAEHSRDEISHAWEDVKAMFNGGTRKRSNPLLQSDLLESSCNSGSNSPSKKMTSKASKLSLSNHIDQFSPSKFSDSFAKHSLKQETLNDLDSKTTLFTKQFQSFATQNALAPSFDTLFKSPNSSQNFSNFVAQNGSPVYNPFTTAAALFGPAAAAMLPWISAANPGQSPVGVIPSGIVPGTGFQNFQLTPQGTNFSPSLSPLLKSPAANLCSASEAFNSFNQLAKTDVSLSLNSLQNAAAASQLQFNQLKDAPRFGIDTNDVIPNQQMQRMTSQHGSKNVEEKEDDSDRKHTNVSNTNICPTTAANFCPNLLSQYINATGFLSQIISKQQQQTPPNWGLPSGEKQNETGSVKKEFSSVHDQNNKLVNSGHQNSSSSVSCSSSESEENSTAGVAKCEQV